MKTCTRKHAKEPQQLYMPFVYGFEIQNNIKEKPANE